MFSIINNEKNGVGGEETLKHLPHEKDRF